jgi:hypothetical protein
MCMMEIISHMCFGNLIKVIPDKVFEVSVNKGMYQKVVDVYINQTANLLKQIQIQDI